MCSNKGRAHNVSADTLEGPSSLSECRHHNCRCRGRARNRLDISSIWALMGITCLSTIIWCLTQRVGCRNSLQYLPGHEWRSEYEIARARVINNIGPAVGAVDGVIIASPSNGVLQDEPNYYYTWTRDSALTMKTLAPLLRNPKHAYEIESLFRSYISLQASLQTLETPSGGFWNGGLSEPKYNVDGSAYVGDWGRPQRDGPALRVLALLPYANFLLDRGFPSDAKFVREHLYDPTVIKAPGQVTKADLEEVAHNWDGPGFDLWEEISGHHLWTTVSSRSALIQGAKLATRLGDTGAASYYLEQAETIDVATQEFWQVSTGHWGATKHPSRRTGLDCAFPLTLIHEDDSNGGNATLHAASPGALATLRHFAKSFDNLYHVNSNSSWVEGKVLGRYAEDIYDGVGTSEGNPWYICTFSFAHALQLALQYFKSAGEIKTDPLTMSFWAELLRVDPTTLGRETPIWRKGCKSQSFERAVLALERAVEAYTAAGMRFRGPDGRMSEQIHRQTGKPRGARDLTWSYASYLGLLSAGET